MKKNTIICHISYFYNDLLFLPNLFELFLFFSLPPAKRGLQIALHFSQFVKPTTEQFACKVSFRKDK